MRSDRLIGAVGSMIIWGVWFVAVYSLQGLGCIEGWQHVRVVGLNLLTVAMIVLTLVALALIAWNGWRGLQAWRRSNGAADGATEGPQRQAFLGLLMALLAGLALVATVLVAVPILMLDPCAA